MLLFLTRHEKFLLVSLLCSFFQRLRRINILNPHMTFECRLPARCTRRDVKPIGASVSSPSLNRMILNCPTVHLSSPLSGLAAHSFPVCACEDFSISKGCECVFSFFTPSSHSCSAATVLARTDAAAR